MNFQPNFTFGKSNREEWFLSKFPLGKVPAFETTDGTLLFESDAIAQYCAEAGPAAGQLLGTTPIERAQIRQWICFARGEVMENVQDLWMSRMKLVPFDKATDTASTGRLVKALGVLESHLSFRKWLVGDQHVSLADITVASALVWGFSKFIDAEMRRGYPATVAWYERTIEVEGVKQAFGERDFIEKREF